MRTACLKDYDPETYPYYNDFSSETESVPVLGSGKIADNSDYTKVALAVNMPFTDVSPDAWYFAATNYASHNGITSGTGEGLISPKMTATRSQICVIVMNYMQDLSNREKTQSEND